MITLLPDPTNPERLILSQTITLYLDRIMAESLSSELEQAIREQAKHDLQKCTAVKKQVAQAATKLLLSMLAPVESSKVPSGQ